jgi:hypothetical protein
MVLNEIRIVIFDVLMEVIMKIIVFWDMMPCSLVDVLEERAVRPCCSSSG